MRNILHSEEVAERKLQGSKKAWKGQQNQTRKLKIQKSRKQIR